MRRGLPAPWLALLLALVAGVARFVWEVQVLGNDCGYAEGSGFRLTFPNKLAWLVLVSIPVLLTVARAIPEGRSWRHVRGVALLAAGLAIAAVWFAIAAFSATRHCGQ